MRLRIRSDNVVAELRLPASAAGIFTLSPDGARQLAGHLERLAALCDEVSAAEPELADAS